MAGKKTVWVENGLNIGSRDSDLGLFIKVMDILLSASKNLEIIQFSDHFPPILFSFLPLLSFGTSLSREELDLIDFREKPALYNLEKIRY